MPVRTRCAASSMLAAFSSGERSGWKATDCGNAHGYVLGGQNDDVLVGKLCRLLCSQDDVAIVRQDENCSWR